MKKTIEIKPGDKVRYCPKFGSEEKGIVKSISEDGKTLFVVYKCNNEWSRYFDYTAQATDISDIKINW